MLVRTHRRFCTRMTSGLAQLRPQTLRLGQGFSEAMRVTSNGNVGIGTNTPQEKLDVNGRVKSGALSIGPWPANASYMYFGVNTLAQAQAGNYALLQQALGNGTGTTFLNSPVIFISASGTTIK